MTPPTQAEEDEEAMAALGVRWLWGAEHNPWRSLVPELRVAPGPTLHENAAYQCVRGLQAA